MKAISNKKLIKEYSQKSPVDNKYISTVVDNIKYFIDKTLVEKKIPCISKESKILILNEYATESNTLQSSLDLVVLINAPQLKTNTITFNKNKVKKFFIKTYEIWKSSKKKKRKKKRKKGEDKQEVKTIIPQKYMFKNIIGDIHNEFINCFTEVTTIYNYSDRIFINSKEELGFDIKLYFGLPDSDEMFQLYLNEKFKEIDFKRRFINLTYKSVNTNRKIYKIARILNSFYMNLKNKSLNQILLESCLVNCPDELYKNSNDITEIFKSIISYLNMTNFENLFSICDYNISIMEETLINNNDIYELSSFIKNLNNLI